MPVSSLLANIPGAAAARPNLRLNYPEPNPRHGSGGQGVKDMTFSALQTMAITGGTVETLDEVPAHVWKGLPDCLSLRPSTINRSRVGE